MYRLVTDDLRTLLIQQELCDLVEDQRQSGGQAGRRIEAEILVVEVVEGFRVYIAEGVVSLLLTRQVQDRQLSRELPELPRSVTFCARISTLKKSCPGYRARPGLPASRKMKSVNWPGQASRFS